MKCSIALTVVVSMLLAGCGILAQKGDQPPAMEVRPVQILTADDAKPADADVARLVEEIEAHRQAMQAAPVESPDQKPVPEAEPSKAAAESDVPAIPETLVVSTAVVPGEGVGDSELTVKYLVGLLEQKDSRTASEEEAYKRLLGIASRPAGGRVRGDSALGLLSGARDALVGGDVQSAQSLASEALVLIRAKTDPSIDRLFFASAVYSYGNAEVIEEPVFRAGQLVLAVTDLSNFACLPDTENSTGQSYHTKMTQTLAVYDDKGDLKWHKSDGPILYQPERYIATMFLQKQFRLPGRLRPGKYTFKAELVDHLANRQTQESIEFTVR